MPAKRLPWFKMWPEAMRHEKIALLSDAMFRTWVKALADGSEQPVRWRFASVQHAASVTGRPAKHIRDLIAARLLDLSDSGEVWVHDWRQWQDRYESEFTPRTLCERSANALRRLLDGSPEDSANAFPPSPPRTPPLSPRRGESADTEERGERRDTERELEPEPNVPGQLDVVAGGAGGDEHGATAPPKQKAGGREPKSLAPKILEPNGTDYAAGDELGMTEADVARSAEAMLDHFRAKGELRADWHATLRTWVRNAAKFDRPGGGQPPRNGSPRPPPSGPSSKIPTDASAYFDGPDGYQLPRR